MIWGEHFSQEGESEAAKKSVRIGPDSLRKRFHNFPANFQIIFAKRFGQQSVFARENDQIEPEKSVKLEYLSFNISLLIPDTPDISDQAKHGFASNSFHTLAPFSLPV